MMKKDNQLIPKRRFKEFDNDGEWKEDKLENISYNFEYGLNAKAIPYDGINQYIRITDIDDKNNQFIKNDITTPDTDFSISDNFLLKDGDILFARTGASVGKTYKYDIQDGKIYFAGFLIRARIKSEYNTNFIFYNTLTRRYNDFITITSQRSGQPGVNAQEYADYSLMLPSLIEQNKIGDFFKRLDKLITLQKRKLAKSKDLKSAYLSDLFPKEGEKYPKLRFEGFTETWQYSNFGEILKTYSFKPYIANVAIDGQYKIIQQGDNSVIGYSNGYPFKDYSKVVLFGDHTLSLYKPEQPFFVSSDGIKILSSTIDLNRDFLYYLLEKYLPGSEGYKRHYSILKNQNCVITSNKFEQEKIGKFFSQIDNQIKFQEQKLEKIVKIKQAYLNELFV